jgi:hypothetical protein
MEVRRMSRTRGPECPQCGSSISGVTTASLDAQGHRIRLRRCSGCDTKFTSLEIAIPFSFSGADAAKADRLGRRVVRALDTFTVTQTSESVWSVRHNPGKPLNLCRKGLHKLEGENLYVNPASGHRVCKSCRREAMRAAYRYRQDRMPAALKEEQREQRRLESAARLASRREWLRRKRAERKAA